MRGQTLDRGLAVVLCCAAIPGCSAQARSAVSGAALHLELSVDKATYCRDEDVTAVLQLSCTLEFKNTGDEPVILDKGAGIISRIVVVPVRGGRPQPAEAEESLLTQMVARHSRRGRLEDHFVVLARGDTFRDGGLIAIPVRWNGSPKYPHFLLPGDYLIRVDVYTWFDTPGTRDRLQQRWKTKGFLWTKGITSEPLPVMVEEHPQTQNCQ